MENPKHKPTKTLRQPCKKGEKSNQLTKQMTRRRMKKETEQKKTLNTPTLKQMNNGELETDIKVLERQWEIKDVVAEATNIPTAVAEKVLDLFDQECTIPFIARYRKQITGGMEAEKLREVQQAYEEVRSVIKKSENVIKTLAREQKLVPALKRALCNAKTLPEIEHLYAPYKSGGQKTLAGRARALGLEESALHILENFGSLQTMLPRNFVKNDVKGLSTEQEVLTGWQHIIADAIAKNRDILDFVRKQCKSMDVTVTSLKSSTAEKLDKQAFVEGRDTSNYKFENYFNFKVSVQDIKSYQILAINRGENQKVLTTKIVIPIYIKLATFELCRRKWGVLSRDKETADLIEKSIQDAYSRLLEPHICREIRAELTKRAEKESVDVFSANLKRLLLIPPLRGRTILGVDPGFKHGCKLALISSTGDLLETNVIHPQRSTKESKTVLQNILLTHRCETIALGNGTACRETEEFLSSLIQNRVFAPLDVMYCIVNESGVSIYSVTKDAEMEFSSLDPNLRSAVAIARRLQDPLLEYVKVEPKHLGIGQYQHDITEALLKSALDEVVVECVSFVGVDINTCSEIVLRKVSGLSTSKARNIIEWREKNGPFQNRQQLTLVKGFGPKSFEQCAGFVKIMPQTSIDSCLKEEPEAVGTSKKRKLAGGTKKCNKKSKVDVMCEPNPLDSTVIHPESYAETERFLVSISATKDEIGQNNLVTKVEQSLKNKGINCLAEEIGVPVPTMQLITEALKQPPEYDIRSEFEKPVFRRGVMSLDQLQTGQVLTGRVKSVTHFGAFVDLGVGKDGMIHVSNLRNKNVALGDRVTVKVVNLDIKKGRIGLVLTQPC